MRTCSYGEPVYKFSKQILQHMNLHCNENQESSMIVDILVRIGTKIDY